MFMRAGIIIFTLFCAIAAAGCSSSLAGSSPDTASLPGREDRTVVLNDARFGSYVGTWSLHGATLVIDRQRTGTQTTNLGECFPDPNAESTAMCNEVAHLKFTEPTADGITATVTSVEYKEWGEDTAPEGYRPNPNVGLQTGDSFRLALHGQNTLLTTWLGRKEHLNTGVNPNWCKNGTTSECGA